MKHLGKVAGLVFGVVLVACTEPEVVLEGDRLGVRTPVGETGASVEISKNVPAARLPRARTTTEWTHRNGNARRTPTHAALGSDLRQVWATSIGVGEDRRNRIAADPVSDGTHIFAMDAVGQISALSTTGQIVWQADFTPTFEDRGFAHGGGLAVDAGVLYATSGYGSLIALQAATGSVLWEQRLNAPPSGPPAVSGDLVYLVSRDNIGWAIERQTGRIRWQISGLPATAGFGAGAGPAVGSTIAVFPFSSGELIAVLRQGGVRLWSGSVSGRRIGKVYAAVGDFASDPVIQGDTVYAGTQSGRLVALELTTGKRRWTAQFGTLGPILTTPGSLWAITDDGQLRRVNSRTGAEIWSQPLPFFTEEKIKRREGIYANHGPLLAGGRILVPSSDGQMRAFDPSTGTPLGEISLGSGASAAPLVVGGTLYVLTEDGQLRAFR